jgi:two-component system, cell cycle response regulator DivK
MRAYSSERMDGTLKGRKILIVEDDFPSRLYLNKILEKTGAMLLNAVDGREAVETIRQDPDVDLVLMDIQLPLMDGFDAARAIHALRKDLPIIAQTAYGMSADKERIINSGFSDYVIKPLMAADIIKKIESLLPEKK